MTTNTTNPTKQETKTDKQQFADYLKTKANDFGDTVGQLELSGFEFYSLDDTIAEMVGAILNDDPEPVPELDFAIQEFEGLVANLKRVRSGFIAYRSANGEAA